MPDATLSDRARFGSKRWAAETLGKSVDVFNRLLPDLEASGFPRPDPILGTYIKADVLTWIENRSARVTFAASKEEEPNYDQA